MNQKDDRLQYLLVVYIEFKICYIKLRILGRLLLYKIKEVK